MGTLQELLAAGAGVSVVAAAATAIVLALRLSGAIEQLTAARADVRTAQTNVDTAIKALATERSERELERERAKQQIAALISDLENAHAVAASIHSTPADAAARLAASLQRARQALAQLGSGGGAPGLSGNGTGTPGAAS